MSIVLDIGQGAGLAGATGVRPFLPPCSRGRWRAGTSASTSTTRGWQFLESPAFLLAVLALAVAAYLAERGGTNRRDARDRHRGASPSCSGRCSSPARWRPGTDPPWRARGAGVLCAALAAAAVGGVLERAAQPAGRLRPPGCCWCTRTPPRWSLPRSRSSCRRWPSWRSPRSVVLLVRGSAAGRREVRRPADPAVTRRRGPRKLVLAVIDALAPEALAQAIEDDRAPALARRCMERGIYVPTACPRSPRSPRWPPRRSPPGWGPTDASGAVDELVPPRGGALRGVRNLVLRHARTSGCSAR